MEHNLTVWYGTTSEKILAWRELRQSLANLPLAEVIDRVNNFWTYSLWVKKTMDPYTVETWPNPWELIERGEFCRNAIALGQAYTLWLCAPDRNTELWLVNNFEEKDIHIVVVIDENYVLNYTLGQVLTVEQCSFEVLKKITRSDLSHIKI